MGLRRLQWVGHVMMMEERVPKKALLGSTEGRGPVGRPRGRWLDAVDRDTKRMLKCRNRRRLAEDVEARRRQKVEEADAQVGL